MTPTSSHRSSLWRAASLVTAATLLLLLTACGELLEQLTPDTTPPTLSYSGVANGQVVAVEAIQLTAYADDDRGVARVDWRTNHAAAGTCLLRSGTRYDCGPIPLEPNVTTFVTVTAVDDAGNAASTTVSVWYVPPDTGGAFDIELRFLESGYTAAQVAAFEAAVARWETIIVGDVEDVVVNQPAGTVCFAGEPALDEVVDDLVIFVGVMASDGPGGILGGAFPCWFRNAGDDAPTTVVGYMEFDPADLDDLASTGNLVETIVHEMGHVLGIGVYWDFPPYRELLDYDIAVGTECSTATSFSVSPTYTGAEALAAWSLLGGSGGLPVEDEGGRGTQCAHWNEEDLGTELMTGYLNIGVANPLSEVTLRSLRDLSYEVDLGQAEPYVLPPDGALGTQNVLDLAHREILRPPLAGVDPATGIVTPLGD